MQELSAKMSREHKKLSFSKFNEYLRGKRLSNKYKPVRTYQPTYQLTTRKPFNADNVEKTIRSIVDSELAEIEYSEKVIPEVCLSLAETIRNAVKEDNYDRYRIIVSVTIGQRRQQSVNIFHSFLWDCERDAFATHSYENCHIFANVVVYGVYLD